VACLRCDVGISHASSMGIDNGLLHLPVVPVRSNARE
jgi:hypothetical protein